MIVFPNCKINLGLYVTSKRPDGYHSIESLFVPVPWVDVLEVVHQKEEGIRWQSSGLPIPGDEADNLCVKAYHLLQKNYGIGGIAAHLHKVIPMGAGLGGGSSDAAFMLKALDQLFDLKLSESILEDYAARLGSDCPFFIRNKTAYVTGRGELLAPSSLSLSGKYIVLFHPSVHVSTKLAFAKLSPKPAPIALNHLDKIPYEDWQNKVANDFEEAIVAEHPIIQELKQTLMNHGAFYTSMSGSGSAVYGLFHSAPEVKPIAGVTMYTTLIP